MSLEIFKDMNDELISHLNYKNPRTASYIIERNSCSFHAIGGNVYKPTSGVRLLRFNIAAEDFLDPSTLRIMFDIVNTAEPVSTGSQRNLYPVSPAHGWFSRARLLSRGQVVEDISQYNRVHEMFNMFKSPGASEDDMLESMLGDYKTSGPVIKELSGIPRGERQTVLFKPLFGLLSQSKYISLKYSPLTIELELDSDEYANIIKPNSASIYDGAYTMEATTGSFEIQNCMIRADIIKIDSELQNKYDDHLMSGGAISLPYTTYHSQVLKILGTSFTINLSRSLTYLTRVYASFLRATETTMNPPNFWTKPHNCFYHTLRINNSLLGGNVPYYRDKYDIIQNCQLQIGSKLIPDYPMKSSSEAFYFLKKAFNLNTVFNNHVHSFNITAREYLDHKFVIVFDTEKINGHVASFTGMNVKNGEQITLKMDLQTAELERNPEDCHIVLEAEQVLEIKGSYVRVAD